MKLYFTPGACSLAPHIIVKEAGLSCDIEKVDLKTKKTASGADFNQVNPKGAVPTLQLDNGEILTENAVLLQYLADQAQGSNLMPEQGMERFRALEWLNYIATELHKGFAPLFNPLTPESYKQVIKEKLLPKKFEYLDQQLTKPYLLGDQFTLADAYLFTVFSWAAPTGIALDSYKNIMAYQQRVAQRPKVQEALKAEGLIKDKAA